MIPIKRFCYSPKVFVYVNTGGNADDKSNPPNIVDLTGYTTSGSVSRVINQVSSAEITIRNPYKMWTKPGNPTFRPMDTITIFMMRRKGFPVQVFTGYLDRTPYYQLYPGTCTLMASCTLKRLLHTYFDPALPYSFEFMAKYGWIPSAGGGLVNMAAEAKRAGDAGSSSSGGGGGGTIEAEARDVGGGSHPYLYGGGHKGEKLTDISSTAKLDCSAAISLALKKAGMFDGDTALGSSGFVNWGKPGRGKDFTIWTNSGHMFMQSESGPKWRLDTGGPGGGNGARYSNQHRPTGGFSPRHWSGPASEPKDSKDSNKQEEEPSSTRDVIEDSGFGKLLFATLTEIGAWNENQIYIEELPTDIPDKVGRIFREFEGDNDAANEDFKSLLKDLIGTTAQGSGGGNETTDSKAGNYDGPLDRDFKPSTPGKKATETISFNDCAMLFEMAGLPGITYAQICRGESGLRPGAHGGVEGTPGPPGFGIAQMTPGAQSAATVKKWESIGSYFNPWRNALMAKFLAGKGTGVSNYYGTGFVTDPNKHYTGPMPKSRLTEGSSNSDKAKNDKDEASDGAAGDSSDGAAADSGAAAGAAIRVGGRVVGAISQATSAAPDSVEEGSGGGGSGGPNGNGRISSDSKPKIYAPISATLSWGRGWHESSKGVTGMTGTSGKVHWHSGVDAGCPTGSACVAPVDGEIVFSTPSFSDGGYIQFKFPKETDGIPAGTIIGWMHGTNLRSTGPVKAGTTICKSGNPGGGPHVHFTLTPPGGGVGADGKADPVPILRSLQKGSGTPVDGGTSDSGGGGGGDAGSSEANPGAAAFAAQLNWPSIAEMSEALMLQGSKSLMNDKPLMPFIEQLAGGSLRQFQSLPNGTFFAFYPDYFGEMGHRKPYWQIDDVEILDGGIDLTDDNLVTHEYVVGDTIFGGGITTPEKLQAGGVVSVFNAFGRTAEGGEPLVPEFDGKHGKDAALSFLAKYGPRPEYYPAPMVRSPYFEAFLAYQRFMLAWSRQFATQFTFTFMPELYPGGRVAFTNHGLQCYIESVSHSWDYSSGFTTQAVLSAPSAFGGSGNTLAYSSGLVRETNAGAVGLPNDETEAKD